MVRFLSIVFAAVAVTVALPGSSHAERRTSLARLAVPTDLRVVSYFPADAGWTKMWTSWEPGRVDADLARAASLHANTVRAIVQPDLFGYPDVSPVYAARLAAFISLAAAHGLHVQLTLFDWWYRWDDVSGSHTWVRQLLTPYANDARIAFVELRNEILPKPHVARWARLMIPFVRGVLGGATPVTVSVAGRDPVARLARLARGLRRVRPDFWDIHVFGGGGELMYDTLRRAEAVAAPLPLWVGETGYATTTASTGVGGIPLTDSAQEAAQAHFLSTAAWDAHALRLPPVGVWALDDFVPEAVPDRVASPLDPELHFGLFRVDGTAKPAADVVRNAFSGVAPIAFNGGFESAVTTAIGTSVPAEWSLDGNARFAEDRDVKEQGTASGRVALVRSDETASLSIVPPNAGVEPGVRVTAHVAVRRATDAGEVFVVVEWLDASGHVVHRDASRRSRSVVDGWDQLAVAARAPEHAAFARLDLVVRGTTDPVWFDDAAFTRR